MTKMTEQSCRLARLSVWTKSNNAMYRFLLVLSERDEDEFDWDMYHIGEAVDAVQQVMLDHGFDIHRPYVEDDGEHRTVHDYERAGVR